MGYGSTLMRIQSAHEQAGIRFLNNEPGVGSGFGLLRRNYEAISLQP
jgi:hypothetical protein